MARFPKEHVVKVRAELGNAVVVRPGDKLVVGLRRVLDMAQAEECRQRLAEQLPGVDVVIVDNVAGFAVCRDDAAERQSRALLRDNARHILAEYDNPPEGGTLVPRGWVEENIDQIRQQAEL